MSEVDDYLLPTTNRTMLLQKRYLKVIILVVEKYFISGCLAMLMLWIQVLEPKAVITIWLAQTNNFYYLYIITH